MARRLDSTDLVCDIMVTNFMKRDANIDMKLENNYPDCDRSKLSYLDQRVLAF